MLLMYFLVVHEQLEKLLLFNRAMRDGAVAVLSNVQ